MIDKPTGYVTFLFTDIEGSTRLAQKFEDALPVSLETHNKILTEAIESNNGFVFEIVGDAFCSAFEKANDAVKAAVMIQRNLSGEKWDKAVIKVRIGIHSGPAEWNGEKYMGYITLARTARVMSSAFGEQVLISKPVHEKVEFGEIQKITFRDLGSRRLKDLIEPMNLYQVLAPGLEIEFPPLKTLDARPNNLPVQLSSFIGREKEMDRVKDAFRNTHLLTITGSGGTGKTRLALQIAADMIDEFDNGVWFTELASLNDPATLSDEVAKILGVKEKMDQNVSDTLREYLKDKEMLIILDNCEHIVHGCATFAEELLESSPGLKILATSREALHCSGELIHQTLSLDSPDPKINYTAERLTQFEAVRLFIERALAVNSSFRVNNENAPALAEICSQLDGIPLAIELAAARIKILSVENINSRLSNRFKLLTGGKRTSMPRQQTLRALIDWSYDLLPEEEKILWNRLSIFSEGWDLDAAEEICSDEILNKEDILDLLIRLADKSIVIFNQDSQRYKLLETIRQYGEEKLKSNSDTEMINYFLEKHSKYYLEIAENANIRGSDTQYWIDVLNSEGGNLDIALNRASENSRYEDLVRFVLALVNYWQICGLLSEGVRWLETVSELIPESDQFRIARVKYFIGKFARLKGNYDKAEKLLKECLQFFQGEGNEIRISDSLNSLGVTEFDRGNFDQAALYYEKNLELQSPKGDTSSLAVTLNNLGNVVASQGDNLKANEYYERSLKIRLRLSDKTGAAITLNNLGIIAYEQGDYEKADKVLRQSLQIRRELGDKNGISITVINLGNVFYNQGKYEEAYRCYEESLNICREIEDRSGIADSLTDLGKASLEMNRTENALKHFEESYSISTDIGATSLSANSLYFLGRVEFIKGNLEKAEKFYSDSFKIYTEGGNKKDVSLNILRIAELYFQYGQNENAAKLLGFIDSKYIELRNIKFPYPDQLIYDDLVIKIKEILIKGNYEALFDEGRSLEFEQVLKMIESK